MPRFVDTPREMVLCCRVSVEEAEIIAASMPPGQKVNQYLRESALLRAGRIVMVPVVCAWCDRVVGEKAFDAAAIANLPERMRTTPTSTKCSACRQQDTREAA